MTIQLPEKLGSPQVMDWTRTPRISWDYKSNSTSNRDPFVACTVACTIWPRDMRKRIDFSSCVIIKSRWVCSMSFWLELRTEKVGYCLLHKSLSKQKPIIIALYYRPPNKTDPQYIQDSITEITNLYSKFPNHIFWLGGDFNLIDISWPDNVIISNNELS